MSTDRRPEERAEGDAGRAERTPTVRAAGGKAGRQAGSTGGSRSWTLQGHRPRACAAGWPPL